VEYEISWGGDPDELHVQAWGLASVEGVAALTADALADPRYRPGMRILVDYREVDWSETTRTDIEERLDMMRRDAPRFDGNKIAIVMGRAIDYGIMRMLHTRAETVLEDAGVAVERRPFYSLEEAMAWLSGFAAEGPGR